MTEFNWNFEPEDGETAAPDSGFAQLGLLAESERKPVPPQSTEAPVAPARVGQAPLPQALTRRELREREQRAMNLQAATDASVATAAVPNAQASTLSAPAPHVPVTQAPAAQAPVAATPQTRAPSAAAVVASALATPAVATPAVVAPAVVAPAFTAERPRRQPHAPRKVLPRKPVRPAGRPKSFKRRVVAKLMTVGAMAGAGLMMVSTSLPANAFLPDPATLALTASAPQTAEVQSFNAETVAAGPVLTRDSYTATSLREQLFLRYGNRNWSYTNDPNGTIQWPFPIAVPISDGFGERISPCEGCSTNHKGVDFTPGSGAAIQAIADGVVSAVIPSHAGLGNHVIVDHQINGQLVQSVYAHMADGSMRVVVGQKVKVADEIGQVGSTGESTGAHLHLEIHVNGVPVDPFAWLKANAN